ncbi:hypothetical protein Tco_1216119 [Tanacetum coccineum]
MGGSLRNPPRIRGIKGPGLKIPTTTKSAGKLEHPPVYIAHSAIPIGSADLNDPLSLASYKSGVSSGKREIFPRTENMHKITFSRKDNKAHRLPWKVGPRCLPMMTPGIWRTGMRTRSYLVAQWRIPLEALLEHFNGRLTAMQFMMDNPRGGNPSGQVGCLRLLPFIRRMASVRVPKVEAASLALYVGLENLPFDYHLESEELELDGGELDKQDVEQPWGR